MAKFLSAATQSKIELRRDRLVTLSDEHVISETPVALAAIQGAFRCIEVVGAPVDAKVIDSLLQQNNNSRSVSAAAAAAGAGAQDDNHNAAAASLHVGAGTPSVAWCGEQDGSVSLRQLSTGTLEQRFPATRGVFASSIVSVCGMEVWVGYSDGSMRIFSPFRKTALVEFRAHSTTVSSVLFTSLGTSNHSAQFVVSASTDWTLVVWDALRDFSGQVPNAVCRVAVAKSPIKAIASAMYCADEDPLGGGGSTGGGNDESHTLIAVGCGNGSVLMLELGASDVKVLWESPVQQHSVNSVAFIKVFGSRNVAVVNGIVNGNGKGGQHQQQAEAAQRAAVNSATNALIVCYCCNNGAVLARDAHSGSALFVIEKRPSAVLSLGADSASGLLWVGGSDGIITVYNASTIVKPTNNNNEQQQQQQQIQQSGAVGAAGSSHFFPHMCTLQHHGGAYVSAIKCFTGNSSQRRLWTCSENGELQCFLLASNKMSIADIIASGAPRELEDLREQILRNGVELHNLRTAAWRLRLREQLCLEQFTSKNMKVSAFIGGPGWELATVGLENIKMFTLKQRRYMIALQRSSYGGFRAAIHLARRYFLKWTYFSAIGRYRASSLLVAQMFKNVHRFDVQARYLSRLWRETLRIEREAQLRAVAQTLGNSISSGQLRLAFRRWMQWLNSRRQFRSARKICTIIGKGTDQSLLVTYWNALVYATQHRERMEKFGGATHAISRLTTTSLMREYLRKWMDYRKHNAQALAFGKSVDTRGKSLARECLSRYFRRWTEYFQMKELQRVEAEMAKRKKEQEEWEAMIMCDREAMRRELDERKPRLLAQLEQEKAKLAALEDELRGQEDLNAAIQRETLFASEDIPIDPNAPVQEQVACVIEFLKARAIHCYHDIKLVTDLNRKALATLTPPPRVPGGPEPVKPATDQPFGMALLYAKRVYSDFVKEKGLIAMRIPVLKGYTPTLSAEEIKKQVQAAQGKAPGGKAPAAKPSAKPAAKPAAKPGGKAKTPAAAAEPIPVPKPRPPPEPEQYRTYWGVPMDMLEDARRTVAEEMMYAAKQLIVCYDTMHARGLLMQRQATGAQKAALASINPAAAGAYHIRLEWLNEFLINAHLFLRVAIDEYKKRQKQGIETGGIDDLDNLRAAAATAPLHKANTASRPAGGKAASGKSVTPKPGPKVAAGRAATPGKTSGGSPPPAARKVAPTPSPAPKPAPRPAPKAAAVGSKSVAPKPGAKR